MAVLAWIFVAALGPGQTRADVSLPITGEEVGATNPVGAADTNMFRDDELNLWGATRDSAQTRFFPGAPANDALTVWDFNFSAGTIEWGLPAPWAFMEGQIVDLATGRSDYSHPVMAMAYGRVTDPEHDQVVVVGIDESSGINVQIRSADDPGIAVQSAQLYDDSSSAQGVDVAVGDLDRVVDEDGYLHDEIVVVWGPDQSVIPCAVAIEVLDYTGNELARYDVPGCTGRVATAIGDFNGDGNLELAVVKNGSTVVAQVCSLVEDQPGAPYWHLSCIPEYAVENPEGLPSLDVAAGNVLGVGKEEIVIVTSASTAASLNYFNVAVLELSNDRLYESFRSRSSQIAGSVLIPQAHEVRVATGLFRYDPALGYDFGNRQVVTAALGVTSGNQTADIWFMDFSGTSGGLVFAKAHTSTSGRHTAKPSLAVGNFVGHGLSGEETDPTMQAALTYLLTTSDNLADGSRVTQRSAIWELVPPPTGSTAWSTSLVWSSSLATNHGFDGYDPFVVTADLDGDSWRLGIPIRITIDGDPTFHSLIQEPPRHVDYLPIDPDDPSQGFDVINVSGYKAFNVQLSHTESEKISVQSTDTSSWSIGAAPHFSYDSEVIRKTGMRKVERDRHVDAKVEASYQQTVKDTIGTYLERSATWTNSTEVDDQPDVWVQDIDIWRYPIIGFETDDVDNPVGYYEITIPGATYETLKSGKQWDWYAPLHVNENILSYPQYPSSRLPWVPSDVGSFQVPVLDEDGLPIVENGKPKLKTVTGLMNDQIEYSWDGNAHTLDIAFNSTAETTHDKQMTGTLSESLDIGFGKTSKSTIPWPAQTVTRQREFKADVNFHNSNSMGNQTVRSTTMSKSTGVKLTIPAVSSFDLEGRSYSFATAVYSSTEGGKLKVAHTVLDLTSDPKDWWVKQYGRAPDPALNLPFLFTHHDPDAQHGNADWWTLKTNEDDREGIRYQMRGFFMRNDYLDPVTGQYELFGGSPVDGEIVRLCARVHNFSLGVATGDFDADFYYFGWNQRTATAVDAQTGEEVYRPVWIGKATVASLDGLSTPDAVAMREVCVPWDTTGLSQTADIDIRYRFVVNLDENDDVKGEIHELEDAQGNEVPGGNNSGRWPWTGGIAVHSEAEATSAPGGPQLVDDVLQTSLTASFTLPEGDIDIKDAAGFLEGEPVELTAGETYNLRARIVSETPYSGNVWVAFFDGRPREGGELIALELGRGLRQGDNYVWARWTPETPGERELRAYAFHRVSAANREGGTTARMVEVASVETHRVDDDGCAVNSRRGGPKVPGSLGLVLIGLCWLVLRSFKRSSAFEAAGDSVEEAGHPFFQVRQVTDSASRWRRSRTFSGNSPFRRRRTSRPR